MHQAAIFAIPKPAKTCLTPSDYKPISLINYDGKIITKILNNIVQILSSFIHYDQACFIQNWDPRTYIRTCLSLTQHAKRNKIYLTSMALDAEKASDRIAWSYSFKVLEVYNFPVSL